MVVAHQRRLDDLDILPQMLPVGRDHVPAGAKLIVVGVRGEEIDVRQVRRVSFAKVSDQPPERRKYRRAGFVGNVIAVQRGMTADSGDQSVELPPLRRAVQRGRREQRVMELPP
ncbi:MAG TPA: hypothetical protein DD670_07000 [Planctomycetaceae bacterium]|nr:hypothetical protein [Planctomycetaceae bacterium]